MTRRKRVVNILAGLLLLGLSAVMVLIPDLGFLIAAAILSLSLTVYGIRMLVYYFSLARYMVSGKILLYIGIVVLDLGVFVSTQTDAPRVYILVYLLGFHAFSGVVSLLRALEARRYTGTSWHLNALHGILNLLFVAACLIFLRSDAILTWLYAAGLAYSALVRIATALRKTAIVYIQ